MKHVPNIDNIESGWKVLRFCCAILCIVGVHLKLQNLPFKIENQNDTLQYPGRSEQYFYSI